MKIFTALIGSLFFVHSAFTLPVLEEDEEPLANENFINSTPSALTSTTGFTPIPISTSTSTKTPPLENNHLKNISIQDFLSSDKDASEKIEKKIVHSISLYSSNCSTYKRIDLSTNGLNFPGNSITVDLGSANATFYNIRISEKSQNSSNRKLYSTLVECDSARTARIEVKLLKDFEIFADLNVTKKENSSNESESFFDILDIGSMSLTLENNSISKQLVYQTNQKYNVTTKLIYSKSVMTLDIDKKFQMPIHKKVEAFFDEIEPLLSQFLVAELDEKLAKSNISVGDSCSTFINTEKLFNNNTNDFYVISNPNFHTFEGISLNSGPILIDGLSSFDNIQLVILENETSSLDNSGDYTPNYDDPDTEEIIVRIKTRNLKGKADWSYNSKQKSIFFNVEFIQLEVKMNNTFRYSKNDYEYDNSISETYTRSNSSETNVNIYLGNIQINSSESCNCENESEFVNFLLSGYLKTVIANSLKNSFSKKVQSLFVNCV